jgi:RND family efflux transporter MFP subunit
MSAQQIRQYMTAARTATARLEAAQAGERVQQLRQAQTRVLASDAGVISARSATVGAVLPAGQELFRLIRRGRLEWRAEVAAADLARLRPGQAAHVTPAGGQTISGTLRMVAPTVETETRNGLAYVDLPPDATARAGMFARGELDIGKDLAMTLPQSAVLLRDGFTYVMRIGPGSRAMETKVTAGRRVGDRIEITGGIEASAQVVASGGAFLGDGDLVRVVDDLPAAQGEGTRGPTTPVPSRGGRR